MSKEKGFSASGKVVCQGFLYDDNDWKWKRKNSLDNERKKKEEKSLKYSMTWINIFDA
jgi:hypothetical protein